MLQLLPGLVLVRRDADHLQLGVDPPLRAVLPDHPDVRRLVADLTAGRAPDTASLAALRALDALRAAGLVRDLPVPSGVRVALDAADPVRRELAAALGECGLTVDDDGPARLVVVARPGPAVRDDLDALMRAGTDHLVLQGTPRGVLVGPYVVPGVTACLRCVDARLAERDPRRGLVVDQVARASRGPHFPGDPALTRLALTWAAYDLARLAAGERPVTWSTTVAVEPSLALSRRTWPRHPHCGCAWDQLAG
ncbi:TOMM precursor leader peptide-binding protein [Nocardioides sp. SYSU D00038]|uniref:TOMM precursor leader peptide-binding protein n=1 Tax=Nocardioides sp. SYSU D00038 TaxID=2812554 RepID=UPI001967A415|nr:TOMM precursor leader peptide-binding protein [Nocardioides sp. SYSU D00038]